MPITNTAESPIFRVRVIIDGTLVVSRDFKQEHAAVRAYDRATALYGIGERRPKSSGIAKIDRNFEPHKRSDWRHGFGWY
jgi:hypothetical protein